MAWLSAAQRVPGVLCGIVAWLLPIVLCGAFPALDPALSAPFYAVQQTPAWYLKDALPWAWLYTYGELPAFIMATGAVLVLLGSLYRAAWRRYRRACLLLVLAVALGPGLLVNGLLQPLWGRPRPRHIEQFAGTQPYRPWWQPGGPGAGKSFPSGHAAMGYVLLAGAVLVPGGRRGWSGRLALGGALAYGTLVGLARVVQGGHFASDVVWSGLLMYLTVLALQKGLGRCPPAVVVKCPDQPQDWTSPRAPC
jgi:membrane-associated PAP2 superfamily phosphatase